MKRCAPWRATSLHRAARRAAEGGVKSVLRQGLLQPLRFPQVRVQRPMIERIDAACQSVGILMYEQPHPAALGHLVAHRVHCAKFPSGIDMQQREGWGTGIESLSSKVQHDGAVLAD